MREILFRGIDITTREWATGFYFEEAGSFIKERPSSISTPTHFVVQKTVGQYIGVRDKNGVRIFEGDIVKTKTGRLCEVYWFSSPNMSGWDLRPVELKNQAPTSYDLFKSDNLEVVGNIYDNPELLEVK